MNPVDHYAAAVRLFNQAERAMGRCIVTRLESKQEIASLFVDGRERRTHRGAGDLILAAKVSERRTLAALRALREQAPELIAQVNANIPTSVKEI